MTATQRIASVFLCVVLLLGAASCDEELNSVADTAATTACNTNQPSLEVCQEVDAANPCSISWVRTSTSDGAALGTALGRSDLGDNANAMFDDVALQPMLDAYVSNRQFRAYVDDLIARHRTVFPSESAEADAFNAAAGLHTAAFQLAALQSEIAFDWPELGEERRRSDNNAGKAGKGCSDVGLVYGSTRNPHVAQGHNEDWDEVTAPLMRMVSTPDWTSYTYPGLFAGFAFAVNRWGLVFTVNSVFPDQAGFSMPNSKPAFGANYLLRHALSSRNMTDLLDRLSMVPTYHGFSLNVMDACHAAVFNIEGYGDKVSVQKRNVAGAIYHFNKFLNLNVGSQGAGLDSDERLAAAEAATFTSVSDILQFLGNPLPPVYHTYSNSNNYTSTMATWLVDESTNKATAYRLPNGCANVLRHNGGSRCSGSKPEVLESFRWTYTCSAN